MTGEKASYKMRRMRRADLEQVFALEQIIFPTPWSFKSYEFELERNPASEQWLIETLNEYDEWRVVAYSVCWKLGDELHIANIAVAPGQRRLGLGRRLLRHVLQRAIEQDMESATLEVRAGNHAAQALYASFGFTQVGRRKQYYSDNREDALLLQLPHLKQAEALWPPDASGES